MGVNYGLNRVRFTAPVPVGSYVRGRVFLKDYQDIKNGAKLTLVIFDPTRTFQEMYTYIYGICQNDGEKFVRGLNQKENKQIMQMQQSRMDKKQIWEKKKEMR